MKLTPLSATNQSPLPKAHGYGFDEAGRGCLAGPVVASVVYFSSATNWERLEGLDDSKKLTEKKRLALVPLILEEAQAYGIGLSWQGEIDEINIINATFRAMCRAFILMQRNFAAPLASALQENPIPSPTRSLSSPHPHPVISTIPPISPATPVFIDGNLLIREDAWQACAQRPPSLWHSFYFPPVQGLGKPLDTEHLIQTQEHDTQELVREFPFPHQQAVVGGDGLVACISAASILAKTTRDALMDRFDKFFPHYGFKNHKGYGTKRHREAIVQHGPCPLHRHSFIQKTLGDQQQLSLFQ